MIRLATNDYLGHGLNHRPFGVLIKHFAGLAHRENDRSSLLALKVPLSHLARGALSSDGCLPTANHRDLCDPTPNHHHREAERYTHRSRWEGHPVRVTSAVYVIR
jgi:hypothetical protein